MKSACGPETVKQSKQCKEASQASIASKHCKQAKQASIASKPSKQAKQASNASKHCKQAKRASKAEQSKSRRKGYLANNYNYNLLPQGS